ncbi:hypothetical protein GCM10027275_30850 [Rhabdobacter roseus]|uniref:Uncharacterized protein n=1 Tax=Rhabdobacter roseus TaxID=1655419 RepID=A0A840TQ65_9BACT|nr:hypothetical protein [Rhabdobacter roseus]MBB5285045.1 hypothetical protein [Rhabdobacter roseus]
MEITLKISVLPVEPSYSELRILFDALADYNKKIKLKAADYRQRAHELERSDIQRLDQEVDALDSLITKLSEEKGKIDWHSLIWLQ